MLGFNSTKCCRLPSLLSIIHIIVAFSKVGNCVENNKIENLCCMSHHWYLLINHRLSIALLNDKERFKPKLSAWRYLSNALPLTEMKMQASLELWY